MAGQISKNPFEITETYRLSRGEIKDLAEYIKDVFGLENFVTFTLDYSGDIVIATIKRYEFNNSSPDDVVVVTGFHKDNKDQKKKWFNL